MGSNEGDKLLAEYGLDGLRGEDVSLTKSRRGAWPPLTSDRFLKNPLQKRRHEIHFSFELLEYLKPKDWVRSKTNGEPTVNPTIRGGCRLHDAIRPAKLTLAEKIVATFQNETLGVSSVSADVANAMDVVLVSLTAGTINALPNAPRNGAGISGLALSASSLGSGFMGPTCNAGVDLVAEFAIKETALYQVTPPSGYDSSDITGLEVTVGLHIFGYHA